jgi:hypothetical protein
MRINWQQQLEGCTLLELRDMLRRRPFTNTPITVAFLAKELIRAGELRRTASQRAQRLLDGLLASKLIAPGGDKPGQFILTDTGVSLRAARAGKRLKRERADRAIDKLLNAIARINGDPVFLHDVAWVAVYGSYLGPEPDLGDIDVAIQLKGRWTPGRSGRGPTDMERRRAAFEGKYPPPESFYEKRWWASWPETYVSRLLRVDPAVTIIERMELQLIGCPYRQIYPRVRDVAAKPDWSCDRQEIILTPATSDHSAPRTLSS